ncbi:MAG: hypothetical protein ACKPJH_08375 [Dolichospermum sp.]
MLPTSKSDHHLIISKQAIALHSTYIKQRSHSQNHTKKRSHLTNHTN